MKRRLAAIGVMWVAGMLLVALFAVVARGPGRTPETWQTALETYLTFKEESAGGMWVAVAAQQVTDPAGFDASISSVSCSRGVIYGTDVVYGRETPTPGVLGLSLATSLHPVPYPPSEVWCVLLDPGRGDFGVTAPASRVVFVALHESLYNAAWVVHEAEALPLSRDFQGRLVALGCDSIAVRN